MVIISNSFFHLQRNALPQKLFRFMLVHIESFLASTKKSVILLHPLIEVFGIPKETGC